MYLNHNHKLPYREDCLECCSTTKVIKSESKRFPSYRGVVFVFVSHIQRNGFQSEKLLYRVANPACGLLNREKRRDEKV